MKLPFALVALSSAVLANAATTIGPHPSTLLLGATDSGILSIDPGTGAATPFAPTGLDELVNWAFTIDSARHVAYLLGRSGGSFAVGVIDLRTQTATAVPIAGFPALGTYNGMLLASDGETITRIHPATGTRTFFASTGLDTGVNFQLAIDGSNHIAYELGRVGGSFAVSAINLNSRTSNTFLVSGFPALEVYNGRLVGSDGRSIFEIDPATGQTSHLASTGLSNGVNFQFVVDSQNDMAYHLGGTFGAFTIAVVDLDTTTSRIIPAPGLVTLGVYHIPEPEYFTLGYLASLLLCLGRRRRSHVP